MELKVWVDGIQRVICGVSESTTCQDIVLALAHATGRTGRFTLIEKWRTTERPLAPQEQPLQVLQKWGEYATDVQFLLIQTDKDGLKPSSKTKVSPQDKKERFTHNFTPPQPTDTSIKRSNTFSGAHTGNSVTSPARKRERFREILQESSISEESETGSSFNSRSPLYSNKLSSSKLPSPTKYGHHKQTGAPVLSSSNHNPESHSPHNSLEHNKRRKSPHRPTQSSLHPQPPEKAAITKSSSKPIPKPRARDTKNIPNGPTSLDSYLSKSSPPDFHEARSSSPLPEFEEYDLDKNFPSASSSSRTSVTSQSRTPQHVKSDSTSSSDESQEYSSLVKLVAMQQERLKMQETEMNKIETEIKSLEEKGKEDKQRLEELEQEIQTWEKTRGEYDLELMEIEAARWPDQLEAEQQLEQSMKSDIENLREKLEKCEQELTEKNSQKDSLLLKIEEKQKELKERKKSDADEEVRVTQEVADVQKLISEQQKEHEEGEAKLVELKDELSKLESTILEKKTEISDLENVLKEANLKEFVITPPSTPSSPSRLRVTSLDDVELPLFKQLTRPPGTIKKAASPQDFSSTVAPSEHPDGVWV